MHQVAQTLSHGRPKGVVGVAISMARQCSFWLSSSCVRRLISSHQVHERGWRHRSHFICWIRRKVARIDVQRLVERSKNDHKSDVSAKAVDVVQAFTGPEEKI